MIDEFIEFLKDQKVVRDGFFCDLRIELKQQLIRQDNYWYLWANHDCKDWDLLITILMSEDAIKALVHMEGVILTDQVNCLTKQTQANSLYSCQFKIKPASDNLGLLF